MTAAPKLERVLASDLELTRILFRLPPVRELTPAQKNLLAWLAEAIVCRNGSYVEGQGEIAAELNVSRRTVIRGTSRLRELNLLEATPTKQAGTGGTDKLRYRLPRWLWLLIQREDSKPETRILAACDTRVTPYPKLTVNKPSKLKRRGESGEASPPERLFGRLAAAVTCSHFAGLPDRRVLVQVANTLPEAYHGRAIFLAEAIARAPAGTFYARGAVLRQKLAAELAADGVRIPPGWNVREPRQAEIVAVLEARGVNSSKTEKVSIGAKKRPSTLTDNERSDPPPTSNTPKIPAPAGWIESALGPRGARR